MLKIAKSVEYAFLGLKYIAENSGERVVSTAEVSEKLDIPYDLLAKIMQKLVKGKIINSVQGTRGGYALIQRPEEITLATVIKALEQPIQLADCFTPSDCKRAGNCCLQNPLLRIQNKIELLFAETSLKEIII